MTDRVEATRRGQSPRKTATKHPYVAIEHRVMDNPAFADLRPSSVRVLLAIARQLTKDNNGQLQATWSWCKRYGVGSDNTLTDAVADLIAHGFVYRTKSHGANGVWAKYAVTWLPIKKQEGLFLSGFKMFAWRDWQPPEKKTSPQKLRADHRKKCGLRGEFPAETAGFLTAETADYESCCHGSSELQLIGNDSPDRFTVPPNLGDWIPEYLKRLTARGLAGACPVAIPPYVIH